MANYYYSGQGSLYSAKRDAATGKPLGFLPIGNVPSLSLDIEISKFEHKESESGNRSLDLTIVQEKKGKFTFSMESVPAENLAIGLYGTSAKVVSGTVSTPEIVKVPKDAVAGMRFPLAHPKVSTVVVKDAAGTTTYVLNDDYTVDPDTGCIILVAGGEILTDAAAAVGATIDLQLTYSYGAYTNLEAFTQSVSPERYLRFEGLNTVDGSRVIVDMYRAQFEPLTGYQLINEEIAAVEMKGSLLSDPFITAQGASKFFRERIVAI